MWLRSYLLVAPGHPPKSYSSLTFALYNALTLIVNTENQILMPASLSWKKGPSCITMKTGNIAIVFINNAPKSESMH